MAGNLAWAIVVYTNHLVGTLPEPAHSVNVSTKDTVPVNFVEEWPTVFSRS